MVIGFDYSGKYPASFCEWKASQVAVFVREDIEGVIRQCSIEQFGISEGGRNQRCRLVRYRLPRRR